MLQVSYTIHTHKIAGCHVLKPQTLALRNHLLPVQKVVGTTLIEVLNIIDYKEVLGYPSVLKHVMPRL